MITISREQLNALRAEHHSQRPTDFLSSLRSQGHTAQRDPDTGEIIVTTPRGGQARLSFQSDGLPLRMVTPSGGIYHFEHDSSGHPSLITVPGGARLEIERDHQGNITRLSHAGAADYRFEYGEGGQLLSVTYPDQSCARLTYSEVNALSSFVDRAGALTRYLRDEGGRLKSIIDPLGRETHYLTDEAGLLRALVFADGSREEYCYDRELGQVTVARRDGSVVTQSLDAQHRLRAIDWAGENLTEFEFDDADHLISARNHRHTLETSADAHGNPLFEKSAAGLVQYSYTPDGLLTQLTTPQREIISYEYDEEGRVSRITDWDQRHTLFSYAADGTVAEVTYSNGLIARHRHSAANRLESTQIISAHGEELCKSLYSYDSLDRLVSTDDRASRQPFREHRRFTYDAEDRLTGETNARTGDLVSRFGYDAKGNLIRDGDISIEVDAHDAPRRVGPAVLEYDGLGNLVRFADMQQGAVRCTYAADGTLSEIVTGPTRIRFEYDALGRRVAKTDGTNSWRYGWSGNNLLWEEFQGGSDAAPVKRDYLFLPGSATPLGFRERGRTYWIQTDARGAAIRVFDDLGEIAWHATYDAFGLAHVHVAKVRQPWRLAGHYVDEETGLYYNFARYYCPWLRTYLSRDPFWYKPEATNYSYARNDPWNRTDPWGTIAPLLVVGAIALGAVAGAAIAHFTGGDPVAGAVEGAITAGSAFLGPLGFLAGGFVAGVAGGLIEQYRRGEELCLQCALMRGGLFLALDLLTLGVSRIPFVRRFLQAVGQRLSRLLAPAISRLAGETIGAFGERAVIQDLERRGFTVLGQIQNNSGHGIDIVARNAQGVLHFFEVKTTTTAAAPALSAAQRDAQRFIETRLSRAAEPGPHWRNTPSEVRDLAGSLREELASGVQPVTQKVEVFLNSAGDEVSSMIYSPW